MTRDATGHITRGVHHIGLTVPDVEQTSAFFVGVLGYKLVGRREAYPAMFVSDGATTISLWQATNPDSAVAFDRKNVIGLHHLAIAVENHATLESLYQRLRVTPGVSIEFSPEQQGSGNNRHMMCSIPGGIRVEFTAPQR
jgi:catechol 2,3-dioxygenase-like lactoylglutathione lyase family enzyme